MKDGYSGMEQLWKSKSQDSSSEYFYSNLFNLISFSTLTRCKNNVAIALKRNETRIVYVHNAHFQLRKKGSDVTDEV